MSMKKASLNCNALFPMVYTAGSLKKPTVSKNIIYFLKAQRDPSAKTSDNIDILNLDINKILPIQDSTNPHAVSELKPTTNNEDVTVILKTLAFPLNPSDKNQVDGVYGTYSKKISLPDKPSPFSVAGNEGLYQVHSFVDLKGDEVEVSADYNLKIGDFIVPRINNSGTWCTFKTVKLSQLTAGNEKSAADYLKIAPVDTSYNGTLRGYGILEAATAAVNGCTAFWFKNQFEKLAKKSFRLTKTKDHYCLANAGNSQVVKLFTQMVKNSEPNPDFNLKTVSVVRERETPEATKEFVAALKEKTHTDLVITETQNQDREFKSEFKKLVNFEDSNVIMAINAVGGGSARGLESKLSNNGSIYTYGGMSLKGITASTTSFIFRNIKYLGLWITARFKEDPKLKLFYLQKLRWMYNEHKIKLDPNDFEVIVWDVKNDSDAKIMKKLKAGLELKGKKPIVFVKHERKPSP